MLWADLTILTLVGDRKMANSLNINLEKGQAIVLNNGDVVYCHSGFGMKSFTSGTALIVKDEKGMTRRISSYDIKRLVEDNE